ncbi:MAG: hypothetical protein A2Y77_08685 [Planctomycetes bacterium RBG_13_62_9]|nr:MAG: hypothetical protein A2Y77_08685 [Planctomycetes bacterium RBG_13_62_9]
MKRLLRQAAVRPPVQQGPAAWSGWFVLLLASLLLPAGCENRGVQKAREEAADAKATVARLQLSLAEVKKENASLNAELKAVRQTRDELQEQVDRFGQEREEASSLARQARDMITQLTARADDQAGATMTLEKQIAELKAQLKERDAVIEALQKGAATAQPVVNETPVEAAATEETPTTEPNETP